MRLFYGENSLIVMQIPLADCLVNCYCKCSFSETQPELNMSIEQLKQAVTEARITLDNAEAALFAFESAPEQNVFSSLDEAHGVLEEKLRDEAAEDCEGAYNCGSPTYEQEFIVDGVHYIGKLSVEYNRHDKTYYYIEEAEFTYSPK